DLVLERDVEALGVVVAGLVGQVELGELDARDEPEADGELRRGRRRRRSDAARGDQDGDREGSDGCGNGTDPNGAHATSRQALPTADEAALEDDDDEVQGDPKERDRD